MRIVLARARSIFSIDGINVFIWELAEALSNLGHEVYVMSGYEGRGYNVQKMFDIKRVPQFIVLNNKREPRFVMEESFLWFYSGSRILKKLNPSMVIINGSILVSTRAFKAVVCHDLEYRKSKNLRYYDTLIYRLFDSVVATSSELKLEVSRQMSLSPSKITRIPVCIDLHKYYALKLSEREHAVLHIGTWHDKNLRATLEAFQKIAKHDRSLKLYVTGSLWSYPKNLLSKISRKVRERIFCLGRIPKSTLIDLYAKVKVTCVPSIYKVPVISPTVLESMASGTPVIGSSTAISNDLLIQGFNGFRVNPSNAEAICTHINALTNDDKLWERTSTNAQSHVRSFDRDQVARQYLELYYSKTKK